GNSEINHLCRHAQECVRRTIAGINQTILGRICRVWFSLSHLTKQELIGRPLDILFMGNYHLIRWKNLYFIDGLRIYLAHNLNYLVNHYEE
ncbi:hypothetical protein GIB67_029559, partial [Kingdonia uniflora]